MPRWSGHSSLNSSKVLVQPGRAFTRQDVDGATRVALVGQTVVENLRQRHHLLPGQNDNFYVRNLLEVFAAQEQSGRVMSMLRLEKDIAAGGTSVGLGGSIAV